MEENFLYGLAVAQLSRRIECLVNRELDDVGLTLSQLRVLMYICNGDREKGGSVFQKDIEKNLVLSNPAVSGIISRLEAKGLVVRKVSAMDSRHKEISTTEAFEQLKAQLLQKNIRHEERLTEGLSEEEKKILQGCLEKMISNMSG